MSVRISFGLFKYINIYRLQTSNNGRRFKLTPSIRYIFELGLFKYCFWIISSIFSALSFLVYFFPETVASSVSE